MNNQSLRRAFVALHFTLAIVVFIESLKTTLHAAAAHRLGAMNSHLALLAGLEALAAILFLIPKTLKVGGSLLLLIFAIAIAIHGIPAELPLLVYAAGVLFVMVHGDAFSLDLLHIGRPAEGKPH